MMGFIEFTFCDSDANEFITLGRTAPMTPGMLALTFVGLSAPNDPDSPFLADLWSDGEHHDDDRPVSVLAIEAALGAPLDRLLAAGRRDIAQTVERLKARRRRLTPTKKAPTA